MKPSPFVSICAWCPDNAGRTATLTAAGFTVSHGICPACREQQSRALVQELPPRFAPNRRPPPTARHHLPALRLRAA